jgi:hypothetical protein
MASSRRFEKSEFKRARSWKGSCSRAGRPEGTNGESQSTILFQPLGARWKVFLTAGRPGAGAAGVRTITRARSLSPSKLSFAILSPSEIIRIPRIEKFTVPALPPSRRGSKTTQ